MNNTAENWEEEFDKKFHVEGIKIHGSANAVKNFISSLLTTHNKMLVEKVESHFNNLIDLEKQHGFGTVSLERRKSEVLSLLTQEG